MENNELEIFTPILTKEIGDLVAQIGIDAFNLFQVLEHIKREIHIDSVKRLHVTWQIIKGFVRALATRDPNPVHYEIVRTVLKARPDLLEKKEAIDLLARKLCEYSTKLYALFVKHEPKALISELNKSRAECDSQFNESNRAQEPLLEIFEINLGFAPKLEAAFEKSGMFLCDAILLSMLKTTGEFGKEQAKSMVDPRNKSFRDPKKNAIDFWINTKSDPLYMSPALILLTEALLQDEAARLINYKEKQLPALTKGDHQDMIQLLSPHNVTIEDKSRIQIYSKDQSLLGSIQIPTVHQDLLNIVTKGIAKFDTLLAQKFVRYLPITCFQNMVNGDPDFRRLSFKRGWIEIADALEIPRKNITPLKEIGFAMAFCDWNLQNISGNLISIKRERAFHTNRLESIEITVGSILLPGRTYEKEKDNKLLIPVLNGPPLVGSNQFYAGQYLLQMYFMHEFAMQSITLFNYGFIKIEEQILLKWAKACDVEKVLPKIIDRWSQDGSDGAQFIKKIDHNLYTLGDSYSKELDFFKESAQIRIRNSHRGIASAKRKRQ